MAQILVVDDDPAVRRALDVLLTHHGHAVALADSGAAGIRAYGELKPEVVILDSTMPGLSGVETLAQIRSSDPTVLAIFLTAFGTIRSAVEAIRAGGFEFLTKPFDNDELMATIERALTVSQLRTRVLDLEADVEGRSSFGAIVGRSPAILDTVRVLARVARVDTTVLLLGESGTGKELAARSLHRQSRRASQPFVPVNCGAVAPPLADATFFGHERGAFTDARDARAGLFEQANGGTLFLDEVGELPLEIQVKLLRVLQEGEVRRLGGRQPVAVDVRVIAATNRDLEAAVADGRFRDDLFWRLNGFSITLPPLRDRREDLPLLTDHLLDRLATKLSLPIKGISLGARELLRLHDWPGNVRELEQTLQRAMILCDGPMIEPADLPKGFGARTRPPQDEPVAVVGTLDELVRRAQARVERSLIESALSQCRGNRTKAAAMLGISRRTLFDKLKKLDLANDDADDAG